MDAKEWHAQFLVDLRNLQFRQIAYDRHFRRDLDGVKIDLLKNALIKHVHILGKCQKVFFGDLPHAELFSAIECGVKYCLTIANLCNQDVSLHFRIHPFPKFVQEDYTVNQTANVGNLAGAIEEFDTLQSVDGLRGVAEINAALLGNYVLLYQSHSHSGQSSVIHGVYTWMDNRAREDVHYERKKMEMEKS